MTITEFKKQTRTPKITKAVINQIGDNEYAKQVLTDCKDGADGWSGFIYYNETVDFFKKNKKEIIKNLEDLAFDMGYSGPIEVIKHFRNGKDYSESNIAKTLYGRNEDCDTEIANVLAWYCLEIVAYEFQELNN